MATMEVATKQIQVLIILKVLKMRSDYTHMTLLVDRSGSMTGCWNDTINGLKSIIDKQAKEPGKLTVSVYFFDTVVDCPVKMLNVQDVNKTLFDSFSPRGMTSLLDAMGVSILETGEKLSEMQEDDRPEKVLFVVLTDGGENSSRDFKADKIKEMVSLQKHIYKWDFDFIGADFDAFTGAASGFGLNKSATYRASKDALGVVLSNAVNSGLSCYRGASLANKKGLSEYMEESGND